MLSSCLNLCLEKGKGGGRGKEEGGRRKERDRKRRSRKRVRRNRRGMRGRRERKGIRYKGRLRRKRKKEEEEGGERGKMKEVRKSRSGEDILLHISTVR